MAQIWRSSLRVGLGDMTQSTRVALTISAAKARASKHGRVRAIVLVGVHLIVAIHIAHWMMAKRTLAPMELNESMYTLEQGAITVGGILMALILLSVLLFGRFFCAWGCHVLALQDGAAWLLERIGIRPRPIRSRLAPFIAIAAALSMFVWPQIERWQAGREWLGLRVTTDSEGLGSLVTENFLRNLPGPITTTATFIVCGGVLVWILGSRSFCRVICPYGALFSAADRLSIGAIRLTGDCDSCGLCTATCTSHIRVHEETARHGRVVSPNCLKDLDCIKVCPRNALSWGWGAPSLLRSLGESRFTPNPWTWGEDVLLLVVAAFCTITFRSVYGEVPFFLALGLALIVAWIVVMTVRMRTSPDLRISRIQLQRSGRTTRAGAVWLTATIGLLLFVGHCGWIRLHEQLGRNAWAQCAADPTAAASSGAAQRGADQFEAVLRFGIWHPAYVHRMLCDIYVWSGRADLARPHAIAMTEIWPESVERRAQLEEVLRMAQVLETKAKKLGPS